MANHRDRPLLNLCRDRTCYLQLSGCVGSPTVPAHSNLQRHGRGFAFKSHDCFSVPACNACHYKLDYGKDMTRAEKDDAFMQAWEQWQVALWLEGSVKVA